MFHISDLKKYTRCPRIYINSLKEEKKVFNSFVRMDEQLTDLACRKLGITDYFLGSTGDDRSLAIKAMEDHEWLVKARFESDQLRVKVPFLHKTDEGWEVYFLMAGIYPRAADMQYYVDTIWVLQNNGINITDMHMIHLDADYVRGKQLDPEKLFVISDYFYNNKNNPTIFIKDAIAKKMTDLKPLLDEMQMCTEESLEPPVRKPICTGKVKCSYYEQCFPNEKAEADNSIITLISSQYKYQMKEENLQYLKDADPQRIEGSRQQYAQIMADRNGGMFVDKAALQTWISQIKYPISFIDFEWERFAIPPYEGMKPYDVLPFEYALDIMYEDGTRDHYVYLNTHDDRRDMAESLLEHIPQEGSVIAYNAIGAEMVRIEELANQFPDLSQGLLNINERMEDMQVPFLSGAVYDTRMRGLWSLKTIMSMMDDPGYHDLDIQQGMDAVFQWRHLDHDEKLSEEERQKIIDDLKKYCGMDSYAMTVVFQWLQKISE